MNISVFGLGYVGSVTAACFAARDHGVIGVDIDPGKVAAVDAGVTPVLEPGLADLIGRGAASGRLRATTDAAEAIACTDLSFVCVGTPSQSNGSVNLEPLKRATGEIGAALAGKSGYHCVVFRSTIPPGTIEGVLLPILTAQSGREPGRDFGVAANPEFLREGSAIADFQAPSRTVIGEWDARSGEALAALYAGFEAPIVRTTLRTAELVKYGDNAFHATKVAFANEIGNLCAGLGIDGRALMEIFCLDHRLNLSRAYLRPGGPFGGSCLPKDLRALIYRARQADVSVPLLEGVLVSNERQKRVVLERVFRTGRRRIGLLGLAFKAGTDDLRESPAVELAETLIGKGYDVCVYDPNVELSRLHGANRAYIEREIPHIAAILCPSADALLARAEVLVLTAGEPALVAAAGKARADQVLIDLVGAPGLGGGPAAYEGICW
jgi:GDP-mannose 6-dehydrogenase